jgi:hypothetical protein
VVGFFLHSRVVDAGSNAVFTIVGIRFGRVMEVDLSGSPENKRLVLQPVVYSDDGVRVDPDAPGTGGLVGRVVLVQ